ncbi:MAG: MBL fold metallo-hydrolase [bacterium]
MKIKFWGTRGSIPTPSTHSFSTMRYGGDTSCLSIESGGQLIILDGGSGLRLLGTEFARSNRRHAIFFFTHVHWDHIQGFPFFMPAFNPSNHFEMYGPAIHTYTSTDVYSSVLEHALRGQQTFFTFPVPLNDMPSTIKFYDMDPHKVVTIAGENVELHISCAQLNHPGGCLGYRIEEKRVGEESRVFAYVTDTEHYAPPHLNPNVQLLAQNADVFLYDAQFTDQEYNGETGLCRRGWGHYTWTNGLRECKEAKAKLLVLSHHDPWRDDDALEKLENEAVEAGAREGVHIVAAKQFMEIEI